MNYQHAYHAGNFADVVKHITLSLILQYFAQKEKPFCYIDTHAGEGSYEFAREEMQKTTEAVRGILTLLEKPSLALIEPYLNVVRAFQEAYQAYPGSPLIADAFLRSDDSMILNELHPNASVLLKYQFRRDKNIAIHQRDAYECLPAILPPKEKRAVILIDPPFEKNHEIADIQSVLARSLERFSPGCYVVWFALTNRYPSLINDRKMLKKLSDKYLAFDMVIESSPYAEKGLIGCGMAIINPPYVLEAQLEKVLPYLWSIFSPDKEGYWRIKKS
jgi:23S rRNA (adenine2030-N6)-methyltransferase